jgi:hypothetical protein
MAAWADIGSMGEPGSQALADRHHSIRTRRAEIRLQGITRLRGDFLC